MASWDGDFDFTLDDRTLLRALDITEGTEEGNAGIIVGGFPGHGVVTIQRQVIDKPGFKILLENTHLRTLLRAFLIENIRVAEARGWLLVELERFSVIRWFRRPVIEKLKADLKGLESIRDEAFKKYEMLRRLTDWENTLLKRQLA